MLVSQVLGVTATHNILGIYCVLHSTVTITSAQVPPPGAKKEELNYLGIRTKFLSSVDQPQ